MRQWPAVLAAGIISMAGFLAPVAAATGDFADIPALKARVTDTTGTLAAPDKARIEAMLSAFEKSKGAQIVVLMVPTTQPEAIEQYSIRVAEKWKIGRKQVNDGIVMIVAKNDRKLRIEVGYGLEGAVPDALAKRIISEVISPRFRSNDYAGGIEEGVSRLIGLVNGESLPEPKQSWSASGERSAGKSGAGITEGWFVGAFFFAFLVGGLLRKVFGRFFGALISGGGFGALAFMLLGGVFWPLLLGLFAFILALFAGLNLPGGGSSGGGFSSGSDWSSGGSDSFSGGGGDFGGGGASGDW